VPIERFFVGTAMTPRKQWSVKALKAIIRGKGHGERPLKGKKGGGGGEKNSSTGKIEA